MLFCKIWNDNFTHYNRMATYKRLLKYLSFGLTGILVCILIIATILEKTYGSTFVTQYIYGSPFFILLWGAAAVASIIYLLKRKTQKQVITFCLHLSFVLILAGALTTHLFGIQGAVHLRQDTIPVTTFTLSNGETAAFPFQLSLKEFRLEYYPGTFAPMDFVSTILISNGSQTKHEGEVSMNHIYSYHHYRFYQSKYDEDSKGTTLSVSHDPYGIAITYIGYALLLCCMIIFFFRKDTYFRSLLRHPLLYKAAAVCLLFLYGSVQTLQAVERPETLPDHVARQFGDLYIYYNDRICPLQTLAKDFTIKLYGKSSYKGLTSEQVLTGWFFYYDDWKKEPVIRIKSKEVQALLGIDREYACLIDFVDINGYKLEAAMQGNIEIKDRAGIESANEKFNLISMVSTGSLLKIYPYRKMEEQQTTWYSLADKLPQDMPDGQWAFIRNSMSYVAEKIAGKNDKEATALLEKIKKYQQKEVGKELPTNTRFIAEQIYNNMNYNRPLAMFCITIGLFAFVFYCRQMITQQNKRSSWSLLLNVILVGAFIYLSAIIAFRGYISNHLPLSNGFETMQFMAWCSALLTFFLQRKFYMALPFGFLLCGLTLLVSMLGEANPQITQLMPVLASPLLSIHVVVIMIAYSLLAFIMLNGVTAVILHYSKKECEAQIERLQVISRIILYPAIFLLTVGIFVGAVWANVSWGRYWGWDPKEVWALITMLVYALALHPSSLPLFRKPMFFHFFSIIAFLTVLVTYFGVNFLLGGMHSYANS